MSKRRPKKHGFINDFVPHGVESGTGLVLAHGEDKYLFFLAGSRHRCPPGTRFFAGIGGHRETGETWEACAHREAQEEIGAQVELVSSPQTWLVDSRGDATAADLGDEVRPFVIYEMVHPEGTPAAGQVYHLVIFRANLLASVGELASAEVAGVVALTPGQVALSLDRNMRLADVEVVAGARGIPPDTVLYPLGTAEALGHLVRRGVLP
ncbi:MAG: NUDIX domain-containing protein [Bacillota bacterium]